MQYKKLKYLISNVEKSLLQAVHQDNILKALPVGTVREWGGKRYRKDPSGQWKNIPKPTKEKPEMKKPEEKPKKIDELAKKHNISDKKLDELQKKEMRESAKKK